MWYNMIKIPNKKVDDSVYTDLMQMMKISVVY